MKEIKSVRIRPKNTALNSSDIKITLFSTSNSRKLESTSNGRIVWGVLEYPDSRYSDNNDNFLINDYIRVNSVSSGNKDQYEIIQDPWLDQPPLWRSYGFDPYYLNNGSKAYISWVENGISQGGRFWSDDLGNELDIQRGLTQSNKSGIIKSIKVVSDTEELEIDKNGNLSKYNSNSKDYIGTIKDIDILNELITIWKIKVPNYNLELCNPNNVSCNNIEYISPIDNLNQVVEPEETNSIKNDDKLDLKVLIPENLQLKVKEDIPSLKIYIGDIPKLDSTGFEFGDFEEDFSLLGDEFTESEFTGFEETSQFESQGYDNEADRIQSEQQSEQLASEPYIPSGKHKLDMIPGVYKGNPVNGKPIEIQLCQIHGKPINVKLADSLLDMIEAASKEGVIIKVTSGFRPAFYPNLNAKSSNGVTVTAQSQEDLYKQNCKGGKCQPDTAKAGTSKHGSGIAVDFNTGSRGKSFKPLNTKVYTWLVKNSWRFGFVRTVKSEEWHYEFYPDKAKKGPYAILAKSNELFYADLGLNNLQIS